MEDQQRRRGDQRCGVQGVAHHRLCFTGPYTDACEDEHRCSCREASGPATYGGGEQEQRTDVGCELDGWKICEVLVHETPVSRQEPRVTVRPYRGELDVCLG